jgi:hypothetical protein
MIWRSKSLSLLTAERALTQPPMFQKQTALHTVSAQGHTNVGLGFLNPLTASTVSRVFPGRPAVTTRYDGVMHRDT